MVLTVEGGTGLSDAEAYASVADLDAYVTDFGLTLATSSTAEKEVALRIAARDMDAQYKLRWKGERTTADQFLDWPRTGVLTRDGRYIEEAPLPTNLKRANIELAIRSRDGDTLTPDVTNPGNIKREKIKAGEVEQDTTYQNPKEQTKKYTIVENLLRDLIIPGGMVERG